MAKDSTISISFELKDGTNGFKILTVGAKDLQKVLDATVTEAQRLNDRFVNFAAIATGVNAVSDTLTSLLGTLSELSDAYSAQMYNRPR